MRSREELLAVVDIMLHRAADDADGGAAFVLSAESLRDAVELAASADPGGDPQVAMALGMFHWARFEVQPRGVGDGDLAESVLAFAEVYQSDPAAVPDVFRAGYSGVHDPAVNPEEIAGFGMQFGISLLRYIDASKDSRLLHHAYDFFLADAAIVPGNHPLRVGILSGIVIAGQKLFAQSGETGPIAAAVEAARELLSMAPYGHPQRPGHLLAMVSTLQQLSDHTGDPGLLDEAIAVGREAVSLNVSGDAAQALSLAALSASLRVYFSRTGDVDALAEAVKYARAAVSGAAPGEPFRPRMLSELAMALRTQFERTGDAALSAEAVQAGREAVEAASPEHLDYGVYLANLSSALLASFEHTGDVAALAEAVRGARGAVAATPKGRAGRAALMTHLLFVLLRQFEQAGDAGLLTEALDAGQEALASAGPDHQLRAMITANLGSVLRGLYEHNGDVSQLAEAVRFAREAVEGLPAGHRERNVALVNLAMAELEIFAKTGDKEPLEAAIRAARDGVEDVAADDPRRHEVRLILAVALHTKFERTGDVGILNEAIDMLRDALRSLPASHHYRASVATNLSIALSMLSDRTGETDALVEAVQVGRDAVVDLSPSHARYALTLGNLGAGLGRLFRRTNDVVTLIEAVQVLREAVRALPVGNASRMTHLSNLGVNLRILAEHTGEARYLAEGIESSRQALQAASAEGQHGASIAYNLSVSLQVLYERTEDLDALAEAIRVGRDGAGRTGDDEPGLAVGASHLGEALLAQFERTGDLAVLAEARDAFRRAAESTTGSVAVRLWSYQQLAALPAHSEADIAAALQDAEEAIALLPHLAPRTLVRGDREHRLGSTPELAGIAAAAALAAGRGERAVELLEQARGVLVADALDARSSELARLREIRPDLAAELQEQQAWRESLDRAGTDGWAAVGMVGMPAVGISGWSGHDLAETRAAAQSAWSELVGRVRDVAGFADFLAAPGIDTLTAQAQDGPVVMVTTSTLRCDALILTGDARRPVRVVPLKRLTDADAHRQRYALLHAEQTAVDPLADPAERRAAQEQILEILAWLWDAVTEPVLTDLGYGDDSSPDQALPRVWWCPVGILASLPLHAAGHHEDVTSDDPALRKHPRTVLDRVVSSYTTTLRALGHARSQPSPSTTGALIVAVPDAPDTPPLPGVVAEAERIKTLIPTARVPAKPTRQEVLAALPDHPVAHFACHGFADWTDPGASLLVLHDHQSAPLTMADISALRINGALAFLSACETASATPRLANESVHLTGAFYLAGFPHVIGTLWRVDDSAALRIAVDVYTDLTRAGTIPPQTARSAEALHRAVRALRDGFPDLPTLWAAHTHTGI